MSYLSYLPYLNLIVTIFFAVIWNKEDPVNLLIKMILIGIAIINGYNVFNM